ncbi:uncharacterized protein H6S33_011423 [Morchella sextelata]|uniref:uncharacterized protein n=1 Tax=Morchella sextelata TaxID=1174677 RepID=UPI001D049F20|nr:uncharacterized protein H6S33_011423 [Morchella sextelata]KAH0610996.1 hypothetical protein H6S33_011423 [Morchella sextelata]
MEPLVYMYSTGAAEWGAKKARECFSRTQNKSRRGSKQWSGKTGRLCRSRSRGTLHVSLSLLKLNNKIKLFPKPFKDDYSLVSIMVPSFQ